MKHIAVVILALALTDHSASVAQEILPGTMTVHNTLGLGTEVRAIACPGNGAPGQPPSGIEWTCEVWWERAGGEGGSLVPLARFRFREATPSGAGVIAGNSKVAVPGTLGGDRINIRLRVWFNDGDSITSWQQALDENSHTQQSVLIRNYELSGVRSDGSPTLGSGSLVRAGLTGWECVGSPRPDSDGDGVPDAMERGFGRYQIVPGRITWQEAAADAVARGGHLATVTHLAEWEDLKAVLGQELHGRNLWLGGTDAGTEGTWRWITGEPWSFTHWRQNEPGNDSLGTGLGAPENHLMIWGRETAGIDGQQAFWNDAPDTGGVLAQDGYVLEKGYWTDPQDPDTDDDGLSDGEEAEQLHRYELIAGPFTWPQAQADSLKRRGYLATITSSGERTRALAVLANLSSQGPLWLGATNATPQDPHGWRWITAEPWSRSWWGPSQPAAEGTQLSLRLPEGDWVAGTDSDLRNYLMEESAATSPVNPDTDGDGLRDGDEWRFYLTRPDTSDTDGDSLPDMEELRRWQTQPLSADTDGDGLSDGEEVLLFHSNPNHRDSDGDGYDDGFEVANGSDPASTSSLPGARVRATTAIHIEFDTRIAVRYQLQQQHQDAPGIWVNFGGPVVGTGGPFSQLISSRTPGATWRVVLAQ